MTNHADKACTCAIVVPHAPEGFHVPGCLAAPPSVTPLRRPNFADQAEVDRRLAHQASLRAALETIPKGFSWASFVAPELAARVKNDAAIAHARTAVAEAAGVLLTGGAGTGKTSLACAMMRALVETGDPRVLFVGAYWLAKAREQYRLGQGEAPEVERAIEASVLVIDDVGIEQARNTALSEVIYERHAAERRTIITTGFGFKALAERYGDGIARRMSEGATVIRCGTAERRTA